MARILCIESSIDYCSICIHDDGVIIYTETSAEKFSHSSILSKMVQEAFAEVDKKTLEAIAVAQGPGSYTALRVGLSTAKGLCYGLNIPLILLSTLEIIASPYIDSDTTHVISTIDARRDEIYTCIYDKDFNIVMSAQALVLTEQSFQHYSFKDNKLIFCGNGATKVKELCSIEKGHYYNTAPYAEHMVQLSISRYQNSEFSDVAYATPVYIKPPNITKQKKNILTRN